MFTCTAVATSCCCWVHCTVGWSSLNFAAPHHTGWFFCKFFHWLGCNFQIDCCHPQDQCYDAPIVWCKYFAPCHKGWLLLFLFAWPASYGNTIPLPGSLYSVGLSCSSMLCIDLQHLCHTMPHRLTSAFFASLYFHLALPQNCSYAATRVFLAPLCDTLGCGIRLIVVFTPTQPPTDWCYDVNAFVSTGWFLFVWAACLWCKCFHMPHKLIFVCLSQCGNTAAKITALPLHFDVSALLGGCHSYRLIVVLVLLVLFHSSFP